MDAAHVLRLLVAGGFVDPAKVEQARAILANCAPAKIPFIDRHIAAGQPPKPAGAVPLPEPAILSQIGREGWTKSQVEAYGDAREAAARAVAVPDGLVLVPREATPEMLEKAGAMDGWDGNPSYADKSHSEWWDSMIAAAPIPQQPAAEGAGREAGWVRPSEVEAAARNRDGSALAVFVHPERTEIYSMAIYTRTTPAADAGGLTEDEDGMPVGYSDWYNRQFFGQPVNTARDHACESAWRAALAPEVRHGE